MATADIKARLVQYLELQEQVENLLGSLDTEVSQTFKRYFAFRESVGQRLDCRASDYSLDAEAPMAREGLVFSHDCFNHGYDLHEKHFITLPFEYLDSPEEWEKVEQARFDARQSAAERARQKVRRRQYEEMHAEFGNAS